MSTKQYHHQPFELLQSKQIWIETSIFGLKIYDFIKEKTLCSYAMDAGDTFFNDGWLRPLFLRDNNYLSFLLDVSS